MKRDGKRGPVGWWEGKGQTKTDGKDKKEEGKDGMKAIKSSSNVLRPWEKNQSEWDAVDDDREYGDVLDWYDIMRGNAAGNEIRETDGETKLLTNEHRKRGGGWENAETN